MFSSERTNITRLFFETRKENKQCTCKEYERTSTYSGKISCKIHAQVERMTGGKEPQLRAVVRLELHARQDAFAQFNTNFSLSRFRLVFCFAALLFPLYSRASSGIHCGKGCRPCLIWLMEWKGGVGPLGFESCSLTRNRLLQFLIE